jgi:uncharacterized protein YcaQ
VRSAPARLDISDADARLLFLAGQGLADDPARRATLAAVQDVVDHLGFVQVDTINVIERAHHLIMQARLEGYRHPMLARLLEDRRSLFEHWTHDASVIPTRWFPHWRVRFGRYSSRGIRQEWWKARFGSDPERVIDMVRQRIARDGPAMSKDFEHDGAGQPLPEKGWWGWKPQKAALEHLWRTGELAIARRVNFQKVYDLTERVIPPAHHEAPAPDDHEHVDWACRSALERLGVATAGELAAFWRAITPAAARQWCAEAAKAGEIVAVNVRSANDQRSSQAFASADILRRLSRAREAAPLHDPMRIRLLCPFDPVIRDRRRTMRLFGFDYSFEGFVPQAKRRFGYYVMPMLEGDRFIGRVDPKFDRQRGELIVQRLWWEPKVKASKARRTAVNDALQRLAMFIGADRISHASGTFAAPRR